MPNCLPVTHLGCVTHRTVFPVFLPLHIYLVLHQASWLSCSALALLTRLLTGSSFWQPFFNTWLLKGCSRAPTRARTKHTLSIHMWPKPLHVPGSHVFHSQWGFKINMKTSGPPTSGQPTRGTQAHTPSPGGQRPAVLCRGTHVAETWWGVQAL